MSTDADNNPACPSVSDEKGKEVRTNDIGQCDCCNREKKKDFCRKVSFPDEENKLVTQYFEPANPWQNLLSATHEQLTAEYLEFCRHHNTEPITGVVEQIQSLPANSIGGGCRAPRLSLSGASLRGSAAVDALEAVLRRVQLRRLDLDQTEMDDEGAEAMFDMIEYYESAVTLNISGAREFGIRGWQACSRMIKKSAELSELEVRDSPLEAAHAPVLARALRPHTCRLRALRLQRAALAGEPLLCLVIALKSNGSIRELQLGDNNLTPNDAKQIASLLRFNTTLQLLDLSNNQIQDTGTGHISDALVEQAAHTPPSASNSPMSPHQCSVSGYEVRGLAVLVLWNNQLTRNSAHHLGKALRSSASLCVLNVGRNALGGEAVRALKASRALLSLGLQASRLGPDAAHAIGDLIKAHTQLQRLDLRDNKLGCSGLQAILTAMRENHTLTQIDLDDATESSRSTLSADSISDYGADAAERIQLTREIRALCRRNEPSSSSESRPHRKISLTCHSAQCLVRSVQNLEEEQRTWSGSSSGAGSGGRLRSPAPSPAPSPVGSPVPSPQPPSRFSVTRVTPDRDRQSSTDSSSPSTPTRPSYFPSPSSRFRVVQVVEPPQIRVQSSNLEQSRRPASRFSVTRNYDASYNPVQKSAVFSVKGESDSAQSSDAEDNAKYRDKSEDISDEVSLEENDLKVVTDDKLDKNSAEETDDVDVKAEVPVKPEASADVNDTAKVVDSEADSFKVTKKDSSTMKQIEAITEDLGILLQEMRELSTKTSFLRKTEVKNDGTQTEIVLDILPKSRDDTSVPVSLVRDNVALKKNKSESSLDSPDLEVSRLMNKRLTGSAFCDSSSSLEISGSSMESLNASDLQPTITAPQPRVEVSEELDRRKVNFSTESSLDTSDVTPVNSGHFLNTSVSSNESISPIIFGKKKIHGSISSLEASISSLECVNQDKVMVTSADSGIEYSLRHPIECSNDTLTNPVNKPGQIQDTLTLAPKRTSSLLDVPSLKTNRTRKISWVAPESELKPDLKLPSHLDKLLSLFQHPASLFRNMQSDDDKKSSSASRKDTSFWPWGTTSSAEEKVPDPPSVDQERVQVTFVDEIFSKKLDSKTSSTDSDTTLSEYQSLPTLEFPEVSSKRPNTDTSTDDIVQKLDISDTETGGNGNEAETPVCDSKDLIEKYDNPNDLNRNVYDCAAGDDNQNSALCDIKKPESLNVSKKSFSVLKSSGSENSLDRQLSPDTGQNVDKLPTKVIRGIKENISPENTLTSSITTNALAEELLEKQMKIGNNQQIINTVWEVSIPLLEKKYEGGSVKQEDSVDVGKDALAFLIYENQDFEPESDLISSEIESKTVKGVVLSEELRDAELKEYLDLSPELVIEETPETAPVKLKRANSLEDLSEKKEKEACKIAFKIPEIVGSVPKDIPDQQKLRSKSYRSGSSPKSLPESLNPVKMKRKVSSLGKIARDSLLALNMSEDEIAEFRRSYKLTSVESLRSLESVSEDASNSVDSRCKTCIRTSQESLMSLDSISEDCRCSGDCDKSETG